MHTDDYDILTHADWNCSPLPRWSNNSAPTVGTVHRGWREFLTQPWTPLVSKGRSRTLSVTAPFLSFLVTGTHPPGKMVRRGKSKRDGEKQEREQGR